LKNISTHSERVKKGPTELIHAVRALEVVPNRTIHLRISATLFPARKVCWRLPRVRGVLKAYDETCRVRNFSRPSR
jgi:hypothetical protein